MSKPLTLNRYSIAAILLIAWGLMGLVSLYPNLTYDVTVDPAATSWDRANMPMPLWLSAVYILAVVTGLLGAVALLMRRRSAVWLSAVSLIAVVVQFGYVFLFTGIIEGKGVWTAYFPIAIFVVQVVQLWVTKRAKRRGLLR